MLLVRAKVQSVTAWKCIRKSNFCCETAACAAGLLCSHASMQGEPVPVNSDI